MFLLRSNIIRSCFTQFEKLCILNRFSLFTLNILLMFWIYFGHFYICFMSFILFLSSSFTDLFALRWYFLKYHFNSLLHFFFFFWESVRECAGEGQRILSRLHTQCAVQCGARSHHHEIMTWAEIKSCNWAPRRPILYSFWTMVFELFFFFFFFFLVVVLGVTI